MLNWNGNDHSMKMRETSRAIDKKLWVNNYLEDGTINAQTKTLAFTVIPTDAGVYKVVEAGAHKETITEAIFTPASI